MPVTGTALLRPGDPPREGVVEFTDERRTVALPIRAALPILTKAHALDDLHPSVRLLTSSALLGLRLVAAGRIEAGGLALAGRRRWAPRTRTGSGRWSGTAPDDEADRPGDARRDRRRDAAGGPAPGRAEPAASTGRSRSGSPAAWRRVPTPGPAPARPDLAARRGRRGGARRRRGAAGAPGARRAGPAAPLRRGGAVDRVRTGGDPRVRRPGAHARRDRAARRPPRPGRCSTGWPSCVCPTRSPSTPTSWSASSTPASPRWRRAGVDVLWPRSLGRDLTATAVLDRATTAAERQRAGDRAVRAGPDVQLPVAGRPARRAADRGGDGAADRGRPPRSSSCAAAGRSSTRPSPARRASG